ncbi:hypothetical protein NDU88_006502 [Pleurodeles waltl]|uniref:SGNH hydrolase-type esterase domain-containing protein n=1 Tax=Pleurodeles waltl TaxID=8319 RepID=A0AAV7SPT6_PLEWA|nr:hypothetical protein NDU88_006502 [Pleurodeles waltl]
MAPRVVWVLGHSFVRRAAYRLQQLRKPNSATSLDVAFRWCGVGGKGIKQLQQLVDLARGCPGLQSPDLIIIHLGGNDLVHLGRKALREAIFLEITKLAKQFPNAAIAWSHMVPRKRLGPGIKPRTINVSVRRLNAEMSKLCPGPT